MYVNDLLDFGLVGKSMLPDRRYYCARQDTLEAESGQSGMGGILRNSCQLAGMWPAYRLKRITILKPLAR